MTGKRSKQRHLAAKKISISASANLAMTASRKGVGVTSPGSDEMASKHPLASIVARKRAMARK